MTLRRYTRRQLLAFGGGLLPFGLLRDRGTGSRAGRATPLRIGAILPRSGADAPDGEDGLHAAVAEGARMGTVMAEEEFGLNAELLGRRLEVLTSEVTTPREAADAALRLIQEEGAYGLLGGFGDAQARVIGHIAARLGVPFLNCGASSDGLRHEACGSHTLHLEPSAAMYLDALAGWHVRAGFRRWYFVREASPTGAALHRRGVEALGERHFGAREVGQARVPPASASFGEALGDIGRSRPDLVVLLLPAAEQLAFLERYEEAGGNQIPVVGFPHPETQTRRFFDRSRRVAPQAGSGHRATAWEPTLDAYGARELNSRFRVRWARPMDPSAWASYQGVKILWEGALLGEGLEGEALVRHFTTSGAVFDVWKGIGTSFRPWDRQLRQSLYLVKIRADAEDPWELATVVGELPAIYMPGTDPVERLDQLGDGADRSRCAS